MFKVPKAFRSLAGAVMAASLIAVPALAGRFVAVPDQVAAGLEPKPSRFDVMLVSPDADLRAYSRVAIGSVIVVPLNRDMAERMTEADREDLVSTFRTRFASGLGDRLAKDGGEEGALVLSAAITRPCPSRSLRNRDSPPRTGEYSPAFEAILNDGRTGKVVAVIADVAKGSSFTCWGVAHKGFRLWGKTLGRELGDPAGS